MSPFLPLPTPPPRLPAADDPDFPEVRPKVVIAVPPGPFFPGETVDGILAHAAWVTLIHPDDLTADRTALDHQPAGERVFIEPVYRVKTSAGSWRGLSAG